jgi:hypothetical protein
MYYFHQQGGTNVTGDEEGSELPDLQAARQYALLGARELLAHAVRFGTSVPDRIFVVGEDGEELLTVFITEALPPSLQKKFRDRNLPFSDHC